MRPGGAWTSSEATDFNTIGPEEGRLLAASGRVVCDACPLAAALTHEREDRAEIVAPGISRRQHRGGAIDTVSRIDRVFAIYHMSDLRSCKVHAGYLDDVHSPRMASQTRLKKCSQAKWVVLMMNVQKVGELGFAACMGRMYMTQRQERGPAADALAMA